MDEKVIEAPEGIEASPLSWETYVRNEVSALLDIFLPAAINGNVGIRYKKPIISQQPGGTNIVYDETKAEAVQVSLVFQFDKAIDIPAD